MIYINEAGEMIKMKNKLRTWKKECKENIIYLEKELKEVLNEIDQCYSKVQKINNTMIFEDNLFFPDELNISEKDEIFKLDQKISYYEEKAAIIEGNINAAQLKIEEIDMMIEKIETTTSEMGERCHIIEKLLFIYSIMDVDINRSRTELKELIDLLSQEKNVSRETF